MRSNLLTLAFTTTLVLGGATSALALQSGGVEIGDLESGSVVGQPFKALDVDLSFTAMEVGGKKAWYPPTAILNLTNEGTGARAGRPVLLKVTNSLNTEFGFDLSADSAFAAPTSMHVKITLKPGETKYIGIPISDLTYVTASNTLKYHDASQNGVGSGQLLILR